MSIKINRYQRERDRTREAFIRSALELVIEQGYQTTTVTEIANRADYGRGTFYLYFEDKADVVWAGLKHYMDDWQTHAFDEVKTIQSLRREYLSWVAVFKNLRDYWHVYAQIDFTHGSAVWQKLRDYLIASYEDNLREARYRSDMTLPVPMMARFLYGAVQETMLWWVENGFQQSPEDLAEMVFTMVYRQAVPTE
ncbi:MAG: TetR/AcrR family transcriptional regulator [Chloroflexota bacterium]